jgi:hypothetical protein
MRRDCIWVNHRLLQWLEKPLAFRRVPLGDALILARRFSAGIQARRETEVPLGTTEIHRMAISAVLWATPHLIQFNK